MANSSCVTEFLLLGFSSLGELQLVLFMIFLCLYLIILSGNITIISVICLDHSLHKPMYFFLCVLSTSEIFYTIVILPKMLINLLSVFRTLSFVSCASQMYFFLGFAVTNCLLLGVMGYDRYAAHTFMKCSLDIANILEEIASLSHFIVFLYFFALFI